MMQFQPWRHGRQSVGCAAHESKSGHHCPARCKRSQSRETWSALYLVNFSGGSRADCPPSSWAMATDQRFVCRDHDAASQATLAASTSAANVDRSIGCNQALSKNTTPLKSQTIALSFKPVKHRTFTRHFNLRDLQSDTNNGLRRTSPKEVRSGEGATLARDGFAVPSTGRVQQHEQMETPRGRGMLGALG